MARKFVYDGREFPDPGAHMTPDDVRTSMVTFFPELANANVKGPRTEGEDEVWEFERRVGTKGVGKFEKWGGMPIPDQIPRAIKGWPYVVVKLNEEEYQKLEREARKRGISPSELVAQILVEWKDDES